MEITAKVVADSIRQDGLSRITTFECTFPRYILTELQTHGRNAIESRYGINAASSRALPVKKILSNVQNDPVIPVFRANGPGMQGYAKLSDEKQAENRELWLCGRDAAVSSARMMIHPDLNVHKQYVNRMLEPYSWCTILMTSVEWDNFFAQRFHIAAEPSMQELAYHMRCAYEQSTPSILGANKWHTPMYHPEGVDADIQEIVNSSLEGSITIDAAKNWCIHYQDIPNFVSAGRCARISYLTHDGQRDWKEDITLAFKLLTSEPAHLSPFEHVARPAIPEVMSYRLDQLTIGGRRTVGTDEQPIPTYAIVPKPGELGYCDRYRGWESMRSSYKSVAGVANAAFPTLEELLIPSLQK